MKKTLLVIVGLLIGCLATAVFYEYNDFRESETDTDYVCSRYSNAFNDVEYIKPSSTVDFYHDGNEYFFNITLDLNDRVDFSGYSNNDTMFVSISFDSLIPYSILEANHKYIQIPLQNGKMSEKFSFVVDDEDNAFSGKDLEILNTFLNQESSELVVSINLFDPNGIVTHIMNVFITE